MFITILICTLDLICNQLDTYNYTIITMFTRWEKHNKFLCIINMMLCIYGEKIRTAVSVRYGWTSCISWLVQH